MEDEADWCASCGRQLAAKRVTETIRVPAPNQPARSGTVRQKGRKQQSQPQPQPQTILKQRTFYDNTPLPLYCSDRCQLADLQSPSRSGALPIGHNPTRHPWALDDDDASLVPDCAVDDLSSVDSASSSSTSSTDGPAPELALRDMDPSLATIFKGYDFGDMPFHPATAPPAVRPASRAPRRKRDLDAEYCNGVIMSGRRLQEWVHPEQPKQSRPAYPLPYPPGYTPPASTTTASTSPKNKDGVIPGWNDGTNAWRASIYNLSSRSDVGSRDLSDHYAYGTQVASTHRSTTGVVPPSSAPRRPRPSPPPRPPTTVRTDPDALLLSKFSAPFSKRTESRQNLNLSSSLSTSPDASSSTMPEYREKRLVAKGAEKALLVPNVTLKVRRTSTSRTGSSLPNTRSPLSFTPLATSDEDAETDDDDVTLTEDQLSELKLTDKPKRPTIESRPWSYDGYKTYTAMPLKRDVGSLWRW
ncbi:hypothetical protein BD626DRAFT_547795 [Schizophyllum amplum]|uniref:Uncharacterized protein n=1 Tax=Schizophyllum amplum TaxID=97359 RepID=A0A550CGZ8_9AGAR|nr:hypothetical protein BD626DRAFT_547795 [Auriculariopsis ampla]